MLVVKDCLRWCSVDVIKDKLFALSNTIKPSNSWVDVSETTISKCNLATCIYTIITIILTVICGDSESSETLFTDSDAIFRNPDVFTIGRRIETLSVVDVDDVDHDSVTVEEIVDCFLILFVRRITILQVCWHLLFSRAIALFDSESFGLDVIVIDVCHLIS